MRQFSLSFEADAPAGKEAEKILSGLNEAQQQAVRATDGPVLIIAGPGSGKTRTLTHRIAYLIALGKARPWEILALTFTNKAAREMKERIQKLVGPDAAKEIWMGTFHSTFARILRREAERIGYTSDFSIYDTDDSERIIRAQMERYSIDPKQFSATAIRSGISSAKNQLISPTDYYRMASSPVMDAVAKVYGPYEQALRNANAMDFDDLLIKPITLFENHPDVLEQYQNRWRFIHIDEYQDTNHAQYVLARQLAVKYRNFCVVGDDAQSIYAFRGADIGNILSFQRDYPNATTIRLEENYRSTSRILSLADSIIRHNQDQLQKSLWTKNPEGDYILLLEAISEKDEAQKIERRIRDLQIRANHTYRDFAVLYRTNAQSRSLEDALRRAGIPYRIVGGTSFYQRKEIKDVLSYLRLLVNPNDAASIRRVINTPTRGIGDKTQDEIAAYADRGGLSFWQAIERVEDIGLSGRAVKAVTDFRFMIAKHAAMAATGDNPADLIARSLVIESGLMEEFKSENTPESLVRMENVQELISAIAEYTAQAGEQATLSSFLQEVSLLTDADTSKDDENRVTLMTLHASKGLEFPVVFVAGLEEGLFPLAMASQQVKDLEEERRLFYVGITRAQERLFLSYARTRFRYGDQQPAVRSRFLDEVDADLVRTEAGGALNTRPDRFTAPKGSTFSYDYVDPHYYKKSLRPEVAKPANGRKEAPSEERRIIYDEDEGGIVPGARVEHSHFGEGKVISIEGRGDQATAVVFFKEVGQKKLKLKMARLRRIG